MRSLVEEILGVNAEYQLAGWTLRRGLVYTVYRGDSPVPVGYIRDGVYEPIARNYNAYFDEAPMILNLREPVVGPSHKPFPVGAKANLRAMHDTHRKRHGR